MFIIDNNKVVQTIKQTDRQTDKHTYIQTGLVTLLECHGRRGSAVVPSLIAVAPPQTVTTANLRGGTAETFNMFKTSEEPPRVGPIRFGVAVAPPWHRTRIAVAPPQWFRSGSAVVPQWFRSGSAVVPQWFRSGSAVVPQ